MLWLREKAHAVGKLENLEVRLLDRDPEGRWYLIDPRSGGSGFVVVRASDLQSPAADAAGGRVTDKQQLERHADRVNLLWLAARHLDDWLPAYESWKSDPKNQTILGLR